MKCYKAFVEIENKTTDNTHAIKATIDFVQNKQEAINELDKYIEKKFEDVDYHVSHKYLNEVELAL